MNRLGKYDKNYESGQVPEGQDVAVHLQQTNEKKNKYYSYKDHDETIRKKLILDYHQHPHQQNNRLMFADDKQPAISTKYTLSHHENHNKTLIDRLETSLKTYQPLFGNNIQTAKIDFTELDLKMEFKKQNESEEYVSRPQVEVQAISSQFKNKRAIEESEKLVQEFLPRHRVNKVDREIASLYKQNRNVNLEFRRDKFMQIFTGKSQFSKKDIDTYYKYS